MTVDVIPHRVLDQGKVVDLERPPPVVRLQVGCYQLGVVYVAVGPHRQHAGWQIPPLDQGEAGVEAREEELSERRFSAAENVCLPPQHAGCLTVEPVGPQSAPPGTRLPLVDLVG